jgi:alkylhydroperoxidase family enzyme
VFDPKTTAALTLADAMSGDASHDIDAALATELRSHFSEQELGEIILLSGQANLNNRVGNAAKQLLDG